MHVRSTVFALTSRYRVKARTDDITRRRPNSSSEETRSTTTFQLDGELTNSVLRAAGPGDPSSRTERDAHS